MNPKEFVNNLSKIDLPFCFNPYSELCPVIDLDEAVDIRCNTLQSILEVALDVDIESMWIGREYGYAGGRYTGLAFTDEYHLAEHGERWGIVAEKSTCGGYSAERTASNVWKVLTRLDHNIFLWNVFPFHSADWFDQFANRPHNAKERKVGIVFLKQLIEALQPKSLVAVGRVAEDVLFRHTKNIEIFPVRHPSHGGQTKFLEHMCARYNLERIEPNLHHPVAGTQKK